MNSILRLIEKSKTAVLTAVFILLLILTARACGASDKEIYRHTAQKTAKMKKVM